MKIELPLSVDEIATLVRMARDNQRSVEDQALVILRAGLKAGDPASDILRPETFPRPVD